MSASTMSVFEYLESMPGMTFARLYQHPSTALAIFRRMLSHLGTYIFVDLELSAVADFV